MTTIILFDGECNFCNQSVQFIINRDRRAFFKFASLQSEIGKQIKQEHGISNEIDSFLLVMNKKCYYKSTAALHVCKKLTGLWKLMYVFIVVPKPFRDLIYEIVAVNRYKWFGKKTSCIIPTPEIKNRFLM